MVLQFGGSYKKKFPIINFFLLFSILNIQYRFHLNLMNYYFEFGQFDL